MQTLIRESLPLITEQVTDSPDANTSFKSILSEAGAVYPTLELMHELGKRAGTSRNSTRSPASCNTRFYHRYMADIHTLHAIRELDRIFAVAEPILLKYREVLHETGPTPAVFDFAAPTSVKPKALKDVEFGVEIAMPLLKRLQIDPAAVELLPLSSRTI
ncbi:MAG: hypothetical protein IPP19_16885 [Verrucomicrobia bacterium]|nr:hypothetical protein [Verrucomicrobiota bacterium]